MEPGATQPPPGEGRAADRPIGGYAIERELARGGMGVVYVARHLATGRRVALKQMTDFSGDTRRFHTEAVTSARLRHPNVVAVHEVGVHGGFPFLVMDLIEGESLKQRIAREGQLAARDAASLAEALARAVQHAHGEAVLHRDLKPANVLLDAGGRPVLTDFGLAQDLAETRERLTQTGQVLGTPGFMAPEQADGDLARIGPATDVYGLGATLYAMLTGKAPFGGEGASPINILAQILQGGPRPPSTLHPGLDPDLEAVCLTALELEPEDRYATAQELAADLRRFLDGVPTLARPRTRTQKLGLWVRRHRAAVGVGASLLCLAVVTAVVLAVWPDPELKKPVDRGGVVSVDSGGSARSPRASAPTPGELAERRIAELVTVVRACQGSAEKQPEFLEAVVELGRFGPAAKEAGPLILEVLPGTSPASRTIRATVVALQQLGCADQLASAFAHPVEHIRRYSARDLHGGLSAAGVAALLKALQAERVAKVRKEQIAALGRLGPSARSAVPELLRLLGGTDTRRVVLKALLRIGGPDLPQGVFREAVRAWLETPVWNSENACLDRFTAPFLQPHLRAGGDRANRAREALARIAARRRARPPNDATLAGSDYGLRFERRPWGAVTRVRVAANDGIAGLQVDYGPKRGEPIGALAEGVHQLELPPGEYLTAISGTFTAVRIRSLKLHTNLRPHGALGPLGEGVGVPFRLEAPADHEIAGLRGRTTRHYRILAVAQLGIIVRRR